MGQHEVKDNIQGDELRAFVRLLLADLRALERMIDEGRIESGIRRIGAEQEVFLVDDDWQPASTAMEILNRLGPSGFTSELALFNLEANLSPVTFSGNCLSSMHAELDDCLKRAREAARESGSRIVLCGILPTLHQSDLTLENMTPNERYRALNDLMKDLRGGEFQTYIKGLDELQVHHDNVMMEACNTSFQVHFQVAADEFARLYNFAQAVTGPVLAAAVNSPVLLQHRLWHETRVALFQQSLDSRSKAQLARGKRQRVSFGESWVDQSVVEIFREDIGRYRVLLAAENVEDPMEVLDRGEIPRLQALCLHNGTVYRWNRPCYGVGNGAPHLRIENRVLPSGPSTIDEIANAALFFGLMSALDEEITDLRPLMDFDHAKANFLSAARYGLDAQMKWMGQSISAGSLLRETLIGKARAGLQRNHIDQADIDLYLGVIEERVTTGRTGSQWALDSLAGMGDTGSRDERHRVLVSATSAAQATGKPVHEWPLARVVAEDWRASFRTVGRVMTRDVFTVHPEDVIDLAANMMDWEHIRRIPVEDDKGRLVGLLSQRGILRSLAKNRDKPSRPVAVREVMRTSPITVTPSTPTLEAIQKMRYHKVGCLPVVEGEQLVGLVTEHDFITIASKLLEEELKAQ